MTTLPLPAALLAEIQHAGYFPGLVADILDVAIAGETVVDYLVQPETTFDAELRRHLTVLVLTPSRLVAAHVDDHEGDDDMPPSAAATTESVPLREVRSVTLTHLVARPAEYVSGKSAAAQELNLAIGWGASSRIDLEPGFCGNPDCEGDHGYTGQLLPDDIVVRVSGAAEGPQALQRAVAFARKLSTATSPYAAPAAPNQA
ncbi:MAG: DUF5998 family protein [Cellulomonadaceae bacterium]|jgi:hypothetical protein|nr:DUF5998 family protein [Cellulomonadaceae bacterium]